MNAQASFILKLVAIAVIACVPLSGESFYIEIVGKILVMAIFAMSLALRHRQRSRDKLRRLKLTLDAHRGGDNRQPLGD